MDWIAWIRGSLSAALQWFEAHPGTAGWLEAVGSISAIVFVYLFALLQNRRIKPHENTDRIRRAQGIALVLIPCSPLLGRKSKRLLFKRANLRRPTKSCTSWISYTFWA
jgi:hypothetical protein